MAGFGAIGALLPPGGLLPPSSSRSRDRDRDRRRALSDELIVRCARTETQQPLQRRSHRITSTRVLIFPAEFCDFVDLITENTNHTIGLLGVSIPAALRPYISKEVEQQEETM
mmetsp:Transcript_20024/g.37407  ORF Transcript_20024/g.37407 Transcript_20024/m.37407 type:complete len:113 (-) Transcript_20024:2-340(-)